MTQREILLEAMRDRGERLTVAIALERYGVYALSQRMGELAKLHPIRSRRVKLQSGKWVSEYWYAQPTQTELFCEDTSEARPAA